MIRVGGIVAWFGTAPNRRGGGVAQQRFGKIRRIETQCNIARAVHVKINARLGFVSDIIEIIPEGCVGRDSLSRARNHQWIIGADAVRRARHYSGREQHGEQNDQDAPYTIKFFHIIRLTLPCFWLIV